MNFLFLVAIDALLDLSAQSPLLELKIESAKRYGAAAITKASGLSVEATIDTKDTDAAVKRSKQHNRNSRRRWEPHDSV